MNGVLRGLSASGLRTVRLPHTASSAVGNTGDTKGVPCPSQWPVTTEKGVRHGQGHYSYRVHPSQAERAA